MHLDHHFQIMEENEKQLHELINYQFKIVKLTREKINEDLNRFVGKWLSYTRSSVESLWQTLNVGLNGPSHVA